MSLASRSTPMRRSQRRINKFMNKNNSDYCIPNPYKHPLSHHCIPDTLSKQLTQFQFLSTGSLKQLNFPDAESEKQMSQILFKMKQATKKQSQEFEEIILKKRYLEAEKLDRQNQIEEQKKHSDLQIDAKPDYEMDIEYSRGIIQQSEDVSIFGNDNYGVQNMVFYSDHSVHGYIKDEFDLI